MAKITWESEKELEDWIFRIMQEEGRNPVSDESIEWCGRQIELGAYGIIDLMTVSYDPDPHDSTININIIEVKKETINSKAFSQLARYMQGMKHYFAGTYPDRSVVVFGTLVAPAFDMNDSSHFLLSECDDIHAYTVNLSLDSGVSFSSSGGWVKTDPSFESFHELYGNQFVAASEEASKACYEFMNNQKCFPEIPGNSNIEDKE